MRRQKLKNITSKIKFFSFNIYKSKRGEIFIWHNIQLSEQRIPQVFFEQFREILVFCIFRKISLCFASLFSRNFVKNFAQCDRISHFRETFRSHGNHTWNYEKHYKIQSFKFKVILNFKSILSFISRSRVQKGQRLVQKKQPITLILKLQL